MNQLPVPGKNLARRRRVAALPDAGLTMLLFPPVLTPGLVSSLLSSPLLLLSALSSPLLIPVPFPASLAAAFLSSSLSR